MIAKLRLFFQIKMFNADVAFAAQRDQIFLAVITAQPIADDMMNVQAFERAAECAERIAAQCFPPRLIPARASPARIIAFA